MNSKGVKVMGKRMLMIIPAVLALGLLAGACGDDDEPESGLPNPAAVYCDEQGGTVDIRTDAEGNQYGICVFADGSECDEWDFYRGDCVPGDVPAGETGIANPASVYCVEQGGTLDLESGMCTFPDGSQCEEWAFFRGECSPGGEAAEGASLGGMEIPNPASAYCIEVGGTSEIRTADDGSQYGICVLPDGTERDEWELYRELASDNG
jgi:putative hemolysin